MHQSLLYTTYCSSNMSILKNLQHLYSNHILSRTFTFRMMPENITSKSKQKNRATVKAVIMISITEQVTAK